MADLKSVMLLAALSFALASSVAAQDDGAGAETATADDTADDAALLSPEDLQTLVAPVALYPDTLLIQILVAATYPLEIVKAQEFLEDNAGTDSAELEDEIADKGWDESVSVLATAFPDVLTDMASHVDWTDSMGTAMLAQSDDVMDAVQVKRDEAQKAGTLTSNDQQTVEVTQEGDAGDTIVIQPSDPEVVYVPQYDSNVVYANPGNGVGDAVTAGLITFGTFALIDEIFDDDDPWNDYWGCRNCGGWNGAPIVRNPDIDIDVDGDVNIGNRPDIGWKPDAGRRDDARDKIADHRDGGAQLPMKKPDRGDQMRENLAQRTGTPDISRDRAAADRVANAVDRPGGAGANLPKIDRGNGLSQADRTKIADRTKSLPRPDAKPQINRPANKPQLQRPDNMPRKPAAAKAPVRKAAPNKGAALHRSASPARTKAGSARGRTAAGGHHGKRR